MKTKKTSKMGRPRTDVVWTGISVRFTAAERPDLVKVADAMGLSQAEFIRRATMEKVAAAMKAGRVEVRIPRS